MGFPFRGWEEENLNMNSSDLWFYFSLWINKISFWFHMSVFWGCMLNWHPQSEQLQNIDEIFSSLWCLEQTSKNNEFFKSSLGNPLCIDECQANLFHFKMSTPLLVSTVSPRPHLQNVSIMVYAQGSHLEVNFLFCLFSGETDLTCPISFKLYNTK